MERVPKQDLHQVCGGNHFDFDTGECTFFEKGEDGQLVQCGKYPHCMLKVGEPILMISEED